MAQIIISIVIAGLRIAGIKSLLYQAVAHLFVGYLVGAWWIGRKESLQLNEPTPRLMMFDPGSTLSLVLAIALSVVEVGCFLYFRFAVE